VTKALPELAELSLAVAFKGAHLPLDANQRVSKRSQDRRCLCVVGDRSLEVDHPFTQQVPLG